MERPLENLVEKLNAEFWLKRHPVVKEYYKSITEQGRKLVKCEYDHIRQFMSGKAQS